MRTLKFGACMYPMESLPEVVKIAQRAEELGYDSLWIADSQMLARELYVTLTACVMNTSRIKLGAGVTAPYTRHVSVTAGAFASLNELSPGRTLLGLGTGYSLVKMIGRRPARIAELEEYARKLRDLLDNREVEFEGGVKGGVSWLKRPTTIPIYVAGTGPKMLQAAARMTSNIIMMAGSEPRLLQAGLEIIQTGMQEAGKDPRGANVVMWVPFAISEDGAVAREHISKQVSHLVSRVRPDLFEKDRDFVDQLALAGTPEEVKGQLQQMAALSGFDTVVLNTQPGGDRFTSVKKSLEMFAEGVIARLD